MEFHGLNPQVSKEEDREKQRQDMAQRWELVRAAEKIIRRIPEHETDGINLFNVASIICGHLGAINFYIEFGHSSIILNNGANTESLLANFLQKDVDNTPSPATPQASSKVRFQNKSQKDGRASALKRDGSVCVVTGLPDPDVCYIWPYGVNNTDRATDSIQDIINQNALSLGHDLARDLRRVLCPPDSTDFDWNMICLAPYLHRYWSKAYFGLKWVGSSGPSFVGEDNVEYSHYQVEWHWLPAKISDNFERFLCSPRGPKGNGPRIVDLETAEIEPDWMSAPPPSAVADNATVLHAPVESGHISRLKVKTADLEKTKTLIEAQWIALKIAVLCGAADVADKLDRNLPPLPIREMEAMINRNLPKLPVRAELEDPDEVREEEEEE